MLGSSSYRPLVKAHLGASGKLVFLDEMAQIKTPGQGLELAKGCSPWTVPSLLCRLWDRSLHQLPLTWCQWETDQGWGNWAGGCRGGMGSAGRTQKVLVKSAKASGGGGRTGALGALLEGGSLSAGKCSSVRSLGELPADAPGGRTAGERGRGVEEGPGCTKGQGQHHGS